MNHEISPYINKSSGDVYGEVLYELAEADERLVALTVDAPEVRCLDKIKNRWPERLITFDSAGQDMMAAAADLARSGKIPFVLIYAVSDALCAADQVRTKAACHNLPVRVCVLHSGLSLLAAGSSHHSTEDLAVYRAMANMTVIVPADGAETAAALRAAKDLPGPLYMRLNRAVEPTTYTAEIPFKVGKGRVLREGNDVAILACGGCVGFSLQAAEKLARQGIDARVVDMATIKPIDRQEVMVSTVRTGHVVTVEEHSIIGGLGSAVAEVLAEAGSGAHLKRHGMPDACALVDSPSDLLAHYQLDAAGIEKVVKDFLR